MIIQLPREGQKKLSKVKKNKMIPIDSSAFFLEGGMSLPICRSIFFSEFLHIFVTSVCFWLLPFG